MFEFRLNHEKASCYGMPFFDLNQTGLRDLLGGVLNLVLAFSSYFFNMFIIHKIVGVGTLCLQPGTGCGIVVL